MEVLGKFGINPILLLAQTVNFLIVFYILKRFALKPILKVLKEREKAVKDGIAQAEETQKLLKEASEKEREILRKAQLEAKQLLDNARAHSNQVLSEIEEKTKKQADSILIEAKEKISLETKEAEKRLAAHVSQLAVEMLEKSSQELFTDRDQSSVMDKALKVLKRKIN